MRRLSQVVRRRSAKPLYGGSNPPAASIQKTEEASLVEAFLVCGQSTYFDETYASLLQRFPEVY